MTNEEPVETRPGILLVISAPLGAGKMTLCQALLDREPNARLSVSCTTRPARGREVDGYDFFFLDDGQFRRRIEEDAFLEHVRIHDHYFGTLKRPLLDQLAAGLDMVLNVDTRGARAVKDALPQAIRVFVCPPTLESLRERLAGQEGFGLGDPDRALAAAAREIAEAGDYDYIVLLDNLKDAADDLSSILRAERRRGARVAPDLRQLLNTPLPAF